MVAVRRLKRTAILARVELGFVPDTLRPTEGSLPGSDAVIGVNWPRRRPSKMASDGSETVPKRLATDLFLGALPSALNEELLRMLCISHIIVFAPALDEPSTSSDGGFSVEAAINISKKLNYQCTKKNRA